MFKYKILKKGRKWFQAETEDKNKYKAQIEINDISNQWKVGDVVEFEGKFEKKISYGYVKVNIYPCTKDGKQELIKKEQENKEQEEIEKWFGYIEKKNYVYWNGVNELKKLNLNKEQNKRLESAIEFATINQAKDKINNNIQYIKKNIKNYWYTNGEVTVLDNIRLLEKYVNVEEYKKELKKLKEIYQDNKIEEIKIEKKRYFEMKDISRCKDDNYKYGDIIKKNGVLGKVIQTWKYYEPDTMSIGFCVDGGWLKNAKCDTEAVTEEEKKNYYKKEKEMEKIEEKKLKRKEEEEKFIKNVNEIENYIKENGVYPEYPENENNEMISVEGEVIYDSFNIYGGGKQIIVDRVKIWIVINNGSDGGDWSQNNIRTGGAGAIGYYMTKDPICEKYIQRIQKYLNEREDS